MNIPFWKMHGASNDFILVDDRAQSFPVGDLNWIAAISSRRTGVGSEGVLLIQPSPQADFRMRFFNPDGSEADMCGNGARCLARLAHELGVAPAAMTIATAAGRLRAEVLGDNVRLHLTPPRDWRLNETITVGHHSLRYGFVNTGVPHFVAEIENLDDWDVRAMGRAIRYHEAFAPAGTNANFIRVTGPQSVSVRTYERGVEDETLACGTGITASALIAARSGRVTPPVQVTAQSGDVLTVDFRLTATGVEDVTLLGPAVHVFKGTLKYEAGQR